MSIIDTYLSVEKIKNDFIFVNGIKDTFEGSINFSTRNSPCDVYIRANKENVEQNQIDKINRFQLNYKSYYKEIDAYITNHLKLIERRNISKIMNSKLNFDIIEIPQKTDQYDLLLICSKRYNSFIFKRMISIQVNIRNGRIKEIKRLNKLLKFE